MLSKPVLGPDSSDVGFGVIGLDAERQSKVGDGGLVLAQHFFGKAPIVVSEGVVGLQLDSPIIVGEGGLVLTEAVPGQA